MREEEVQEHEEKVQEHEEERKSGDCHGFVSRILVFAATFASTLHLCVGRTSSS